MFLFIYLGFPMLRARFPRTVLSSSSADSPNTSLYRNVSPALDKDVLCHT
jgi:hypothetical protein